MLNLIKTHSPMLILAFSLPLSAQAQDAQIIAANHAQADANTDGLLNEAEFSAFINLNAEAGNKGAIRVRNNGMHARAFNRVDANGDGTVSREELQAMH